MSAESVDPEVSVDLFADPPIDEPIPLSPPRTRRKSREQRPSLWTSLLASPPEEEVDNSSLLSEAAWNALWSRQDRFLKRGGTPSAAVGAHLDLGGKTLPNTFPLPLIDLRWANFRGAVLRGHYFGNANVADADFADCDLTDSDLSQVKNLQSHQLSGANLSRTKLPADIASFPQLENVEKLSVNAGKLFSTMIGAVIFVLLITFTTPDLQILASSGKAKIPVLDLEVSTTVFLIVTPGVLLVLYILVHLYLQRLWAMMAQLPAIFPDGVTVDAKTYPWLVNDRIRTGFPQLNRKPAPMSWLHVNTFGGIVYGVTPVAIFFVYLRCLIRHDWATTGWHILFLSVCLWVLVAFLWFNYITLHRDARWLDAHGNWRRTSQGWLIFVVGSTLVVLFALPLYFIADCAFYSAFNGEVNRFNEEVNRNGIRYTKEAERQLQRRRKERRDYVDIPRLLTKLRLTSYGNIPEEKSLRPEKWDDPINSLAVARAKQGTFSREQYNALLRKDFFVDQLNAIAQGKPGVIEGLRELARQRTQEQNQKIDLQVKQVNLSHRNLDFLQAPSAFLLNADLRGTSLQFANLSQADLRGALLDKNDFTGAYLSSATLTGADLSSATLTGADLSSATLTGADLYFATLTGADLDEATLTGANLARATLTGANLERATLIGANLDGATLISANLSHATLISADFSFATLTGADLTGATLISANLDGVTLTGADLSFATLTGADLRGADLSTAKNLDSAGDLDQVVFSLPIPFTEENSDLAVGTTWPKGWENPPLGYQVMSVPVARLKEIAMREGKDEAILAKALRMLERIKPSKQSK